MRWDPKLNSRLAFGLGTLLPLASALVRLEFLDALGPNFPVLTFYPAVLLAALVGGFYPGAVATLLSGLLASSLWIAPTGGIAIASPADRLAMGVFVTSGLLLSFLAELVHRAWNRAAEAEAKVRLAAEREQSTAALKRERKFLRQVIDALPSSVYVEDGEGRLCLVNEAMAKFYGTEVEALEGTRLADLPATGKQSGDRVSKGERDALSRCSVLRSEQETLDAAGAAHLLETARSPLFDEAGACDKVLVITADITERKQAEEEFRRLNVELDRRVAERTAQLEAAIAEQEAFSYSVSHDLRSPLRHINSYAAILVEELGAQASPTAKDYLERIGKASSKMAKLIEDLLQLARTTRLPLSEEEIDLTRLAKIACLTLKQTAKGRRVEFSIAEGMRVLGDKTLMRLVMDNLLENAWKYTAQEKVARIEVGSEIFDGQPVFYVSDNGTGFDMAYRDKLFNAFQRLHGAEYEGNGIGLATVRRAIERHGGTIWAEGEVGSGATFYFRLARQAECFEAQPLQRFG